ncbi:MAG: hypothetical protein Fur0037_02260 [Planctomycetota bacterium]
MDPARGTPLGFRPWGRPGADRYAPRPRRNHEVTYPMRNLSLLFAPLSLAVPLLAQNPPVAGETATDFGSIAAANTASDFHSIDAHTAVGHHLLVGARAGGGMGPTSTAMAFARSAVTPLMPGPLGVGMEITESGAAAGFVSTDTASCGTSASNQSDPSPVRGAHGIAIAFAAAQNAQGTVTLVWRGQASQGASATVDVDVDGDQVIDFHGVANGTPVHQQFPVTAGANGVVVTVSSQGAADVTGQGHESYGASLAVFFHPTVQQPSVTFTQFGPSCGGTLAGQMRATPRGPVLQLDVTGGAPNALALLVLGDALTTPIALPSSTCQVLVGPHFGGVSHLDANGDGTRVLDIRMRPPVDIDFQMVTLDLAGSTLALASTNGLNLVIQ